MSRTPVLLFPRVSSWDTTKLLQEIRKEAEEFLLGASCMLCFNLETAFLSQVNILSLKSEKWGTLSSCLFPSQTTPFFFMILFISCWGTSGSRPHFLTFLCILDHRSIFPPLSQSENIRRLLCLNCSLPYLLETRSVTLNWELALFCLVRCSASSRDPTVPTTPLLSVSGIIGACGHT